MLLPAAQIRLRALAGFLLVLALAASACSDATTAPVRNTAPVSTGDTTPAAPLGTPSVSPPSVLAGATLWIDPSSTARATANSWRATRPADAAQLDKIAAQPQAIWFGDWNTDIASDVAAASRTITAAGATPVFVAYNIPQRDCGGLSGGNAVDAAGYQRWIDGFAAGLGGRPAAVVLEPDALAGMDCLSASGQQTRLALIAYAVRAFHAVGNVAVYLDAGHPGWQSPATMAARLAAADIADAAGFSLNVSNFIADADNIGYGQAVSALVGNKHFIIDSGRNGVGGTADAQWCNPAGRALGTRPTTHTGVDGLDAFLWIKPPGESDGACNGGPDAGVWWPDYALGLAQRAAY